MRPGIIAVDPGGTESGIVLRRGDELVYHATIKESDPLEHIRRLLWGLDQAYQHDPTADFAVEDVTQPNPHMGLTNVKGLIGTARTLGAVLAWGADADVILVPPGGNGSGPLTAYPPALRPTRGLGRGKDGLRHCRSAWDVAGAAETLLRLRGAS